MFKGLGKSWNFKIFKVYEPCFQELSLVLFIESI